MILLVFTLFLKYKPVQNYQIPIMAFIIGWGSQFMMVVSPVYGPRNALCGIAMIAIYSAFLFSHSFEFNSLHKVAQSMLIVVFLALITVSAGEIDATFNGYRTNLAVERENVRLIEEYKAGDAKVLRQYKLILEDYGWSMPYNDSYHEAYYKKYYNLRKGVILAWMAYPK